MREIAATYCLETTPKVMIFHNKVDNLVTKSLSLSEFWCSIAPRRSKLFVREWRNW